MNNQLKKLNKYEQMFIFTIVINITEIIRFFAY